jgi:hypothetical protein
VIDRESWLSWTEGLDDEAARNALVMLVVLGLAETVPGLPAASLATLHDDLDWGTRAHVAGTDDARWMVRELLDDDRLGSVVVSVERPVGGLRRRPWRWPLRISTLGLTAERMAAVEAELEAAPNGFPPQLLQLARAEDRPGAADILVVPGPLHEATAAVIASGVVANAVVVLDEPQRLWALELAETASIRASTSAGVVALAAGTGRPLGASIGRIVWEMSHTNPVDLALTAAFDRRLLIVAEPGALDRSSLQDMARRLVTEVAMAAPPPETAPQFRVPARGEGLESFLGSDIASRLPEAGLLSDAAEGTFLGEVHEASAIAGAAPAVVEAVEEAGGDRRLQAVVTSPGAPDNVLQAGADNAVAVWIGPVEEGAIVTDVAFPDELLPFDEAEAFRLTVVFAPTLPIAEPQRAEVELRRTGATRRVSFRWRVAGDVTSAEARIVVLFRNRVLQTAVLSGDVGGPLGLRDWVALRRRLGDLDDRQPFDAALVLNHAGDGTKRLIGNAASHATVADGADITPIAERLAAKLEGAVALRRPKKLGPKAVKLLAELAIDGHDLFEILDETVKISAGVRRIQIVRMRGDWVFPIEMTYDRPAPKLTAKLCPTFEGGAATCAGCPNDGSIEFVCPNGFWGLSKTIERLHVDRKELDEDALGFLLAFEPTRGHTDIPVTSAVFAAARQVPPADQDRVVAALAAGANRADTWDKWQAALAATPFDLLVLLPHTDFSLPSLFIGSQVELRRGQIEPPFVTGGHADLHPMVVLFGCETAGTGDDPAGFATRFMSKGAAAVFTSLTKLLGSHAAELAERLGVLLLDASRPKAPLAELLTRFRREAVRSGLLAALAVGAYGDAEWRV